MTTNSTNSVPIGSLVLLDARATAFDRLDACAVVLDAQGVIVDTNAAWRLFSQINDGVADATGPGVNYLDVCDRSAAAGDRGAARVAAGLRQLLSGDRDRVEFEYSCPSPAEDRWFVMQASVAPVADGTGVVVFHFDETARRMLAAELAALTEVDSTGLPSHAVAVRYLGEQLVVAKNTGADVWVVSVSLEAAVTVNESQPYELDEQLLVRLALRIRRLLDGDDHLYRDDGNGFVVICPGRDREGTARLVARLREAFELPFQVGRHELDATVAITFEGSDSGSSVESLLGVVHPQRPALLSAGWSPERNPAAARDLAGALSAVQARGDAAFAYSSDLVIFFGQDGTIHSASPACRAMFGIEPEALVGRHGMELVHPDDRERVRAAFATIPECGDHLSIEFRAIGESGQVVWVEEVATNLITDPNVGGFVGNLRNITERVEMLQRIENDRRRLAVAQASAQLGSFEADLDSGIVNRSDEMVRMLGLQAGSEFTKDLVHVHPADRARVRAAVAEVFRGAAQAECTYRVVRSDGEIRWVLSRAFRVGDSNVLQGTMLDITDRHEAEMALVHNASHDWLTQLPNAVSLHERLDAALRDSTSEQLVAVALLDIDHFKLINDRSGRATGDEVLCSLAARLMSGLRPGEFLARLGSDEFAVVRSGVASLEEARRFGERMIEVLRVPLAISDREVLPTLSIGVALSTTSDSAVSLLRDADDAMYESKRDGRNRITVFDHSARVRAHRRQSLAAALPLALGNDELHLEYQPIVDLATLATVGFEALLRWEHPTLGRVSPEEFIPIAESSGLILPVGAWVLERAMQQLARWRADPRVSPTLWMAINVSAAQLAQPRLPDYVRATLLAAGLPSGSIHLEITESVLMDRIHNALEVIVELRAMGVHVSIDDFGTGSSSLSYLSRLPVDTIKIDRSFVRGLGAGGHGRSIIRAIVALARTLELSIVAEGIEQEDQLDVLREFGCTYGQGFLWSPSLPPEVALSLMLQRAAAIRSGPTMLSVGGMPSAPAADDEFGTAVLDVAHAAGLRRRTPDELHHVLRFDSLEIGTTTKRAWLAGRDLHLTDKEFELLAFLAEHQGEVFSREQLLHEVWDSSSSWQSPATVTEHIHRLRARIEADPGRPLLIGTIRGRGYCFGPPRSE